MKLGKLNLETKNHQTFRYIFLNIILSLFRQAAVSMKPFYHPTVGCTPPSTSRPTSRALAQGGSMMVEPSTTPTTNGCQYFW